MYYIKNTVCCEENTEKPHVYLTCIQKGHISMTFSEKSFILYNLLPGFQQYVRIRRNPLPHYRRVCLHHVHRLLLRRLHTDHQQHIVYNRSNSYIFCGLYDLFIIARKPLPCLHVIIFHHYFM